MTPLARRRADDRGVRAARRAARRGTSSAQRVELRGACASEKRFQVSRAKERRSHERMVGVAIAAEDRAPPGHNRPGDRGRRVIEDDQVDVAAVQRGNQLRREAEPQLEPRPCGSRHLAIEEHGDIHVAVAVRPTVGMAAKEIGGDNRRLARDRMDERRLGNTQAHAQLWHGHLLRTVLAGSGNRNESAPSRLRAIAGTAACTSGSDSVTSPLPLGGVNSAAAKGGNPTVAGVATTTGAIVSALVVTGVFEGGNFSGSGTFTFDLGSPLDLVTGATFGDPALCGGGSVRTTASNFTTLSGTGGSLLEMTQGQQIVKSVRFGGWTPVVPVPKGQGPTGCSLHFRGDAVLDGTTEMSRMLTTCTVHDGTTCSAWTLQACTTSTQGCGQADAPAEDVTVGQLYGDFPRGVGNQPMARYEMPWSMTITRN
jgi:hypothetical protein